MTKDGNLSYAPDELDPAGWNTHGRFYRSSWIRARSIICRFRDEILEVSLQKSTSQTAATLL